MHHPLRYILRWITIWILAFLALCVISVLSNWPILVAYFTSTFDVLIKGLIEFGGTALVLWIVLISILPHHNSTPYEHRRDDRYWY